MILVVLCIVTAISLSSASGDRESSQSTYLTYDRLYSDVLSRPAVSRRLPPCLDRCNMSQYEIKFELLVIDVQDIDELNEVMTLDVHFEILWPDPQLAWNSTDYDGIETALMDSASIWMPSIYIIMGKENSFLIEHEGKVLVHCSGHGMYRKHQYLSFMCDTHFDHYPFDTQTCSVGLFHWEHPFFPISIRDLEFKLTNIYNRTGDWIVEKVTHAVFDGDNRTFPYGFPYYVFTVRRQPTYYVITIVFPMVLTSIMIPLVFLIPAQTGEKISYLVAIFTSTAIFLHYILDVMPRSLCNMPYLAILLIEVLVEGFLATVASLLVVNISKKEAAKNKDESIKIIDDKVQLPPYDDKKVHQETNDQTNISKRPAGAINMDVTKDGKGGMTPQYLDMMFFTTFMTGQMLFLVVLFVGTEWLYDHSGLAETHSSEI